jgi:hypothetical protein
MSYLLAARGRRVLRHDRSQRDHFYGTGQVFGQPSCPILGLMHHLGVTPHEIALLASRVIGTARRGAPVPPPGLAHRITSRCPGAGVTAVPFAVVAVRAQEELLTACPTGHQP